MLWVQKYGPRALSERGKRWRICRDVPLEGRRRSRASSDSMDLADHGRNVGASAGARSTGLPGGRVAEMQSESLPEPEIYTPFVPVVGERRSHNANQIFRGKVDRDGALRMRPDGAKALELSPGEHAIHQSERGEIQVVIELDDTVRRSMSRCCAVTVCGTGTARPSVRSSTGGPPAAIAIPFQRRPSTSTYRSTFGSWKGSRKRSPRNLGGQGRWLRATAPRSPG